MSNLNKVMIIGRLGRDPESRTITSGSTVCNFSLATSERWKDKSGEKQEKTEWHNIVAWGAQATFSQEYLRKGALVYVEGSLQTSTWEKDGVKHYKTEIKAFSVQSLEKVEKQPVNTLANLNQDEPPHNDQNEQAYLDEEIPF